MPTQLETIIAALEKNGEPMTASQLADTLRVNGTGAARPENTVLSLVHKCRDIVNMGGSPSRYGLREWLKGGTEPLDPRDGFGALEAFCAQLRPDAKFCRTEADVREKLVIPVLRDWLGYGVARDMEFERFINDEKSERPDIVVVNGRKRLFFVEIKALGTDLSRSESQLRRYFKTMDRPPVHAGILTDGIRWRFYLRRLRSGIPDALLFCEGSVDRPDMDFLDALSDISEPLFNNDILKTNASRMMADLQKKSKKA